METIKKARNIFYLNYYLEVTDGKTEFELPFPDMVQNIKANNAFISVDSVELIARDGTDNALIHIPELMFNTSIPSTGTFMQVEGSTTFGVPRTTTYFESIQFTSKCVFTSKETTGPAGTFITERVTGLGYKNSNPSRVFLVANPFGNKYTCSWTDALKEKRTLWDQVKASNFDVTLKVELIEEEILR